MGFLFLSCVGSAKGLVHHVNYRDWKGCRCQNKCYTEQNTNLCVKWSSAAEWEKKVVAWWMSAYFKTGARHIRSETLLVYLRRWLPAHCLQEVLRTGPVGQPAVTQLCRVTAPSDHLFPTLSHSRLPVLITACFSTFLPIWLAGVSVRSFGALTKRWLDVCHQSPKSQISPGPF